MLQVDEVWFPDDTWHRYSRHPNYCGEVLAWIGVALMCYSTMTLWGYAALLSPLFVYGLLTQVSGVPMLEKKADNRWGSNPQYQIYKTTTPAMFFWKFNKTPISRDIDLIRANVVDPSSKFLPSWNCCLFSSQSDGSSSKRWSSVCTKYLKLKSFTGATFRRCSTNAWNPLGSPTRVSRAWMRIQHIF